MDDLFDIPVSYNNKELLFQARLLQLGYTYKFLVDVNGIDVFFEKDDEGNYRAVVDPTTLTEGVHINAEFLGAIANSLEEILK